MAEKTTCEMCDRTFKDADGLAMHTKAKHPERIPRERKPLPVKKIRNWTIFILIVLGIGALMYFPLANSKTLPPIDIQGHVEASPESHVLKEPMPIAIQKHMLEHADGTGRPGVIINYNCKAYRCEEDLIEKLEAFAGEYDYVYVAPFKGMDAKIALTRLGKRAVLEYYDETIIKNFIRSG